jgi:type IV pilus assembly protein PilZ
MFSIASEKTYPNGEIIVSQGLSPEWVYVILAGAVEISRMVGGKKCVIALLRPGEAFGELGLFGGIMRDATASAIGETTVGLVDPAVLDREFDKLSLGVKSIIVSVVETMKKMVDRACDFSARQDLRVVTDLHVQYDDKGSFVEAYTGNVSNGGLFVKTETPLKRGEELWLELRLPDLEEPIRVKSEVVWSREEGQEAFNLDAGMGLKFFEITQKDHDVLKAYLEPLQAEIQHAGL